MENVAPGTPGQRRVLMLAYFFPPTAVSGAVRPAAFCAHLREFGYEPHVLAAPPDQVRPYAGIDNALLELVPDSVRIDHVPYPHIAEMALKLRKKMAHAIFGGFRAASKGASTEGALSLPARGNSSGVLDYLSQRLFMFPDQQKEWAASVRRFARRLKSYERPDVVYATGSPWSSLLAGVRISRELNVPLVADFRDPWARNLKPWLSPKIASLAAIREREVLVSATKVVANTSALAEYFREVIPEDSGKIFTITNGINRRLVQMLAGESDHCSGSDTKVELQYFGTVSRHRMPTALIEALTTLLQQGRITSRDLRVSFTGKWAPCSAPLETAMNQLEAAGILGRYPAVSYDECVKQMGQADHLLVLQQGYPLQIPAKLYEYIATGRPMVVIGGEGATADLVNDYGLGVVCEDNAAAITETLVALLRRGGLRTLVEEHARDEFNYKSLTRKLADVFDTAIREYRLR